MKLRNKIFKTTVFFIIISILLIFSTQVLATSLSPDEYKPSEIKNATTFTTKVNYIVTALRVVGTIISVITLIIIGIKFMVGSIEEKAEFKEKMIPYIIGAIMVFAITNILGIVLDVVSSVKMK